MGQKGTGRRLSDQERIEIIAKLEGDAPRMSAADCARQYGVSSAAITKLMKMKDKIKQRFQGNNTFGVERKRGGTERHAAFEDELFRWIKKQEEETHAAEAAAPLLTTTRVQDKAQELLQNYDLGSFRASKGWYYRFLRRYGLSRFSLAGGDHGGEDGDDHSVDHSATESDESGEEDDGGGKRKREAGTDASRKKHKSWAVQSLQDTLAKAAEALDHPEAREYLGEPAACEMLRSIQQSIGVVQCIRLKKASSEPETATTEPNDETTEENEVVRSPGGSSESETTKAPD